MKFYIIPFFVGLFLLVGVSAFGAEVITLAGSNCKFVFDPDSGTIAGINKSSGTVNFYDKDIKLVASDTGLRGPVSVAFKKYKDKSYFMVLTRTLPGLHMYDAKTYKKVQTLRLKIEKPICFGTSSNPDDPYIYYSSSGTSLAGIDLRTMKEGDKLLKGNAYYFVVSANGNFIYYSKGGYSTPQVRCCGLEDGKIIPPDFVIRFGRRIVPDPYENYVAVDDSIYAPDLTTVSGRVPAQVLAFVPGKSAILGVNSAKKLSLMSYNSLKEVQELVLPGSIIKSNFPYYDIRCLVDDKRSRVLLCRENKVYIIPYSEFKFPAEPILAVKVSGSRVFHIGKEGRLSIELLDKNVKYELQDPPEGVSLRDGNIVWTPTKKQVGRSQIKLRVYSDNCEKIFVYDIAVIRPRINLGYEPRGMVISSDGRFVLMIGSYRKFGLHDRPTPQDNQIVLIDAEAGKIVAQRLFDGPIGVCWVDEHYVYMSPYKTTIFYALSHKDLSEVRRIVCTRPIHYFEHNLKGNLVAECDWRVVYEYSLPDLKRISASSNRLGSSDSATHSKGFYGKVERDILNDGLVMKKGCVYDREGKLALIHYLSSRCEQDCIRPSRYYRLCRWNRVVDPDKMRTSDGTIFVNHGGLMLKNYPVAVSIQTRVGDHKNLRLECVLRELVTGKVVETTLLNDQLGRSPSYASIRPVRYDVVNETVYILVFGEFYVLRLDKEIMSKQKKPLYIMPRVSTHIVTADKSVTLQYEIRNGSKACTLELVDKHKGLTLDPKTGVLKVDGSAFVDDAVRRLSPHFYEYYHYQNPGLPGMKYRREKDPFDVHRANYRRIFGREPGGVPVTIPITINVTDADGQSCTMIHRLFMILPDKAFNKGVELAKKRYESYLSRIDTQMEQLEANKKKIDELEMRIRRLEAKINSLLKLLKDQQAAKKQDDAEEQDNQQQNTGDAKKEED